MIGIFDSGYGGLTVLKPLIKALPQYDYLYFGDNTRAPYGNHNPQNIRSFSEEAVNYLIQSGAEIIIIACNTVSSVALSHLQQKFKDTPILGVIEPVIKEVTENSKKVGVVATVATVKSGSYQQKIHEINKSIQVFSHSCPLLVPFIEEGWHTKPEAKSILKKYLLPLKSKNIDTLVLGCTHYPLMLKDFKKVMGKKVEVIPSGEINAEAVKEYLSKNPKIEEKLPKNKNYQFVTTGDAEKFQSFAQKHLGLKIKKPKNLSYSHSIVPGGLLVVS